MIVSQKPMVSRRKNRVFRYLCLLIVILFSFSPMLAMEAPVTAAEVNAARDGASYRVGFFSFPGYHMIDDYGNYSGYGYDYMQQLETYGDFMFEYVGFDNSWAEMQSMLENGEIDILTSAQKTEERMAKFLFSNQPIGSSATILTVKAGNSQYLTTNAQKLNGIRVGMIAGNSRNQGFADYATEQGFTYESVIYDSLDDMTAALQAGDEIDAIVSSSLRSLENEWIVAEFNASPFYIMTRKDDEALMTQINNAIEQLELVSPNLQTILFDKYYSGEDGNNIPFSIEEREYISTCQRDNVRLKVLIKPGHLPVSGLDADGNPSGIIVSVSDVLSARTGLSFDFVIPETREEYNAMLLDQSIDIVLDASMTSIEAEQYSYQLTSSYMTLPFAIVTRAGESNDDDGKIAAMRHENITSHYIESHYSESQIVYYETQEDIIDAVRNNNADMAILDMYSAERYVNEDTKKSLQLSYFPEYYATLSIGIPMDRPNTLLSIMNKAVLSIDETQMNAIISENAVYSDPEMSLEAMLYKEPFLFAGFLTIVFVLTVLLLVVFMRNRARKRENALEKKKNYENTLFIYQVCRAYDQVFEINIETKYRLLYRIIDGEISKTEEYFDWMDMVLHNISKEDIDKVSQKLQIDALRELIRNHEECYFEARALHEDGTHHWYSFLIQALPVDETHPNNMMVFIHNITQTKREETKQKQLLEDALDASTQANAAKNVFLSRMSHEIRTPINAVIGYMALASASQASEEKRLDCIIKSETAAKQLLAVVNNILDVSAFESGKLKIAHESFNLSDLISSLTVLFYNQANAKNVHFETVHNGITAESIIGDKTRVNQILINLLNNAVKFTPEGGRVTFIVRQLMERDTQAHFQFIIKDTGIGMDNGFMDRIYHPFEQEDKSISSKYGGSGLGLSIVKNLVTSMNGIIKLESEKGVGTTFTIELPFNVDYAPKAQSGQQIDLNDVRVLVADNDLDTLQYMRLIIERCNAQCVTVDNGMDALKMAKEAIDSNHPFDMYLIDWKMPIMDGRETIIKLKTMIGENIPVIIVTAYDYAEFESTSGEIGIQRFLSKPVFQSTMYNLLLNQYGAPEAQEYTKPPKLTFDGKKVLLAEDNYMNVEIAHELLKSRGFEVTEAFNGKEAVDIFMSTPPGTFDIILMDIQMPEMDGYEATKAIRESEKEDAKTIPILAMSANAFAEDITKSLSVGMNNHIAKPIDVRLLFEILAEYI